MTDPTKKPSTYGDYRKIANQATANFRQNHKGPIGRGLQVQHWNKVKEAATAKLDPKQMNSNLSLLQSRRDGPATTMLTSPNQKGTTYSVGGKTYGSEHSFADRHLIPAEHQRIQQANPGLDKAKAVQAAGATASWKMRGETGRVDPSVARTVNLAKGEKLQAPAKASPAAAIGRPPGKPAAGAGAAVLPRGPKVGASPAGPKLTKPTAPVVPPAGHDKTATKPTGPIVPATSAPKIAPSTTAQTAVTGGKPASMGSLTKPGGTGGF